MSALETLIDSIWTNELYRRLILTVVIVAGTLVLRGIIRRFLAERFPGDSNQLRTLRSIIDWVILGTGVALVFAIWIQQSADLAVAVGLVAAGLAFALQEVIGSIAGWISITLGKPFVRGDRIEVGGIHGDVVDISMLRTTLMETGNWLGGQQNTGRFVTLSNAFLFKEPLFNYSRLTTYVWDEVRASIPYGQDWAKAKEIMLSAVREHADYQALVPSAESQRASVRRELAISLSALDPRVFVRMADSWIEVGVVYPVEYNRRRSFRSDISETILRNLQAEGIAIAFPTMTVDMTQ